MNYAYLNNAGAGSSIKLAVNEVTFSRLAQEPTVGVICDHEWSYQSADETIADVNVKGTGSVELAAYNNGTTTIVFTDDETGDTATLTVVVAAPSTDFPLRFTAEAAGAAVGWTGTLPDFQIRKKDASGLGNWQAWDGTEIILAEQGDYVEIKHQSEAQEPFLESDAHFNIVTNPTAASGNIMSLLNAEFENMTEIPFDNCYESMFHGCTGLTAAPELPATTLTEYCYSSMFSGCTGLTAAPELPATTLAGGCYNAMFNGCTGLNYVNVTFTAFDDATENWLQNVSATGTFRCPAALDTSTRDESHVPAGWTIETF